MPYVDADDGVRLYFEEAGSGIPIVFVHEYGADYRTWEPQLRHFAKRYRCIAFNARGFAPSDIPTSVEAYSQDRAVEDLATVIRSLKLGPAHVIGLAMGSFATLFHSLKNPELCRSQVVAGCGYGADPARADQDSGAAERVARMYETEGSAATALFLADGPARQQLKAKDPRAWAEFRRRLSEHSAAGAALVQREVLMKRPSVYALEKELAAIELPTLLLAGDEDEPLLAVNLFLKKTILTAALVLMPNAGHTLNLEDPELFNQFVGDFLATVDAGRWQTRQPASRFNG